MVSSSLFVNIFLASKTYAPTRSLDPTSIWVSLYRSSWQWSSMNLVLS
jgi:hypothetical protein